MQWGFLLPQRFRRTGKQIQPKPVANARDDLIRSSQFRVGSLAGWRCPVAATVYCEFGHQSPTGHHWYALADAGTFAFTGIRIRFEGMIGDEQQCLVTLAIATTRPNALLIERSRPKALLRFRSTIVYPDGLYSIFIHLETDLSDQFAAGQGRHFPGDFRCGVATISECEEKILWNRSRYPPHHLSDLRGSADCRGHSRVSGNYNAPPWIRSQLRLIRVPEWTMSSGRQYAGPEVTAR